MREGSSAGATAQAEYDKRLGRHKEQLRRRRPYLLATAAALALAGVGLLNLDSFVDLPALTRSTTTIVGWFALGFAAVITIRAFSTPSHVTAWSTGAEGERRTAAFLEPLESEGFRVLHDRRIPGARSANIDHIVIGPPGVFVIESKSYSGRLSVRGRDVYVAGRRKSGWLDEVRREATAVQTALGPELLALDLTVTPLICVHRAELPLFGSRVDGIPIETGKEVVRRLRQAKAVLSPDDVARLAEIVEVRLGPTRATAAPS